MKGIFSEKTLSFGAVKAGEDEPHGWYELIRPQV